MINNAGVWAGPQKEAQGSEHAAVPPTAMSSDALPHGYQSHPNPVATESRTLARSMSSELPAPCTSRPPPPPVVALPLTT